MSQASQLPPTDDSTQTGQTPQRSPLITELISNHSIATTLSAMRTAIVNGADVNQVDTEPFLGHNEGRPLDACLRQVHMPGRTNIIENLPVIELLLEYGADPRLYSMQVGTVPIRPARRYSEEEEETEEAKAFWRHLLKLFEEAIIRLDAKKK